MSDTFHCGDNTGLVTYLYGECEPPERAVIDAHVAVCAACAAELAALESSRLQLASWTPPDLELGFAITRPQASGPGAQEPSVPAGARSLRPGAFPMWMQVAAAAVIFAAGLALGVARGTRAPAAPGTPAVSAADLSALENRLREELAQLRLRPDATTNPQPGAGSVQPDVEGRLMARVRMLIEESEQRQQRELALRTVQIIRDVDSQRRVDFEQIQRSVGQLEGQTGAEVREQRQMLNYLLRVSEQR